MEIKEAIATAQLMKNQFRAFQKIEELLIAATQFSKDMENQEATISKLKEEVANLTAQKGGLEADIAQRLKESCAKATEEASAILNAAIKKAKEEGDKLVEQYKGDVASLISKRDLLQAEIDTAKRTFESAKRQAEEAIKGLMGQKDSLAVQVSTLTAAKDTLQSQIGAMKEKIANIVM